MKNNKYSKYVEHKTEINLHTEYMHVIGTGKGGQKSTEYKRLVIG